MARHGSKVLNMTTTGITATATDTDGHYVVTVEGQTLTFNAKAVYDLVVISDQGNGWKVRLKTNSRSAAATKVRKQTAVGDFVRCLVVSVER